MSRLWQWYLKNLDARPIMTKTGMTLGLMAVADTGAQVSRRNAPSTSFYLCGWEYISFARTVCKFYSIPPYCPKLASTCDSLHVQHSRQCAAEV